jgi:hypothetical protein
MFQQPAASARIYDFAVHRMRRIARQRRDAGVRRSFLWGNPSLGTMKLVEFPSARKDPAFSALAR